MMNYFDGVSTFEELRKCYKKLAFEHHPDVGGDTATMQKINSQYDILFEKLKNVHNQESKNDSTGIKRSMNETPEKFREAIMKIINLDDITIELCGAWLWVSGKTYRHKEEIKKAGYNWSKNKEMWYWHPDEERTSFYRGKTSMADIRSTYGSEVIRNESKKETNFIKSPKKKKEEQFV